MKKIISATIFMVILAGLIAFISPIMRPQTDGFVETNTFYNIPKNKVDVLLSLSSIMLRATSPMQIYDETGIVAENLGISVTSTETQNAYVKDFFKRQSPKLVIIDAKVYADEIRTKNWGGTYNPVFAQNISGIENLKFSKIRNDALTNLINVANNNNEILEPDGITHSKTATGYDGLNTYIDIFRNHQNYRIDKDRIDYIFNKSIKTLDGYYGPRLEYGSFGTNIWEDYFAGGGYL